MTLPIFRKYGPAQGPYSKSHPQIRQARGDLGIGPPAHDPKDQRDGDIGGEDIRGRTNSRSFSGSGMSGPLPARGGGTKRR